MPKIHGSKEHILRLNKAISAGNFDGKVMSVPKNRIPSPVVIHYWAWYSFFQDGRYHSRALKNCSVLRAALRFLRLLYYIKM